MSLSEIVSPYIPYKQSMGRRLHTADRTLKSFGKAMGEVGIADVQPARGQVFLAGTGPIPRLWHRQQEALRGFYRLAMARRLVAVSPLPRRVPQPPHSWAPSIYSPEQRRRLLEYRRFCS